MAKPPPWSPKPVRRKGRNTVDFAGIMPKATGNRTTLRMAKLLGILDAQAGVPPDPKIATASARNRRLQQGAYTSGYGQGQSHYSPGHGVRYGNYLARVQKQTKIPGRGFVKAERKKLAGQLRELRTAGDVVTLTAYKRTRGIGRNTGSFKERRGKWRKGKGGRFIGSSG